jgi:hypothetical protein
MTTKTKTILGAALLAASIVTPAAAHDYANDLFCAVHDAKGNTYSYAFGRNTEEASGNAGTFVETGFKKNTQWVASDTGRRPVWSWSVSNGSGNLANDKFLTLVPPTGDGWSLVIHVGGLGASLGRYGTPIANGMCAFAKPVVADQGL